MTTSAASIRRRLDTLQGPAQVKVYFVDCDEDDPHRHPDGPEVAAEVAAIEAADPNAHVILYVNVSEAQVARINAEREAPPA